MPSTSNNDGTSIPINLKLNSNKKRPNLNNQILTSALGKSRKEEKYIFNNWLEFVSIQDHILESVCRHDNDIGEDKCQVCRFEKMGLPHLPEMIFPFNQFAIYSNGNLIIEFNAYDALKEVNRDKLPDIKVGPSTVWQNARPETLNKESQNPFDWTYTSNYKGTLGPNIKIERVDNDLIKINYERLKQKDPIQFYSQIDLYEDELADHGCAQMLIRIRIMPSTFLILCRYYLRVDHVMVKIIDTRLYGEDENNNFMIREWSKKEANYSQLNKETLNYILDPTELSLRLPLIETETTKIYYK